MTTTDTPPNDGGAKAHDRTSPWMTPARAMLAVGLLTLLTHVLTSGLSVLSGPIGSVATSIWPTHEFGYEWQYSGEDGLQGATFLIERRPHDCEFTAAPLGAKSCHYDRLVIETP